MFCNQCEQVAKAGGCTVKGVCGKDETTSALQDLLTWTVRGIAAVAVEGRKVGVTDKDVNHYTVKALFSTLTNVNFDPTYFEKLIIRGVGLRKKLAAKVAAAGGATAFADPAANYDPKESLGALTAKGEIVGLPINQEAPADIKSLQEITLYGLRGVAAYADHAAILGQEDDSVYEYIHRALASITDGSLGLNEWVGLALECGKTNYRAMELLDAANTGTYGHPVPTQVELGHRKGKAIVISGHDLKDLENLLIATEGSGINIYTHGEMLPGHGYPGLKKYSHLAGNYGTAWQNQRKEFAAFPGAILMTTNCLMPPDSHYTDKIFATGLVGHHNVAHVDNGDFGPVIKRALELEGFHDTTHKGTVTTGFARNAVLGAAPVIIDAVKSGAIKHFFLVGGCDGAKPGRNYFTDFVEKTPADTIVLTLACGKYRFYDKDLGTIGPFPRLLDVGQCNDAYSAIQIAVALAGAFNCGVNDLPLSIICSWYEQKAVAILLTLLNLGIKNIRLGPSLPAFITPGVLGVLVENFNIMPITEAEDDLREILA